MSDTPFYAKNGIVANLTFIANSSMFALGSNIVANTTSLSIIGTNSNVVINATTIFIGNSSVFGTINSTASGGGSTNTAAQYSWSNTQTFSANVVFTGLINAANASILSQTLSYGSTTNWNGALGQIATLTLTGSTTMAAPTNMQVGTYILTVIQDSTGSRTITWNSVFKWPVGTAPVLTTTASHKDILSFVCDGTNMYGSYLPDVR